MLAPTRDSAARIAPTPVHFTPTTTNARPRTIPTTFNIDFDRWCIIMQPRHAARPKRDGSFPQGAQRARLLYLQPSASFGGAERQASIAVPLLSKLGFGVPVMQGPRTSGLDWRHEYGAADLVHTRNFPGGWRKP